ncbi:MAG: pyridoxamine kinase [Anaerovoracaceae bacterium]
MSKNILLINDVPGYGKVALSAMMPVLSSYGHVTYNLPTALVSNTLDYGKFYIMDTTLYMENSVKIWNELGFKFDCISTGFIISDKQVKIINDYINEHKDALIIVDPIMGDEGKLYNGVGEETIDNLRELAKKADILLPNYTEATFLTSKCIDQEAVTPAEALEIMEALRANGSKSVVISSMMDSETRQNYVFGYSHVDDEYFKIPYTLVPVRFPGTGDIFSSVIIGEYLDGKKLSYCVDKAMRFVKLMVAENIENEDKLNGLPVESYLNSLKKGEF